MLRDIKEGKKKEQENPVKGGTIGPDLPELISSPDHSLNLAMHRCIADPNSDFGPSDKEIISGFASEISKADHGQKPF
jgi:hypothetical protein